MSTTPHEPNDASVDAMPVDQGLQSSRGAEPREASSPSAEPAGAVRGLANRRGVLRAALAIVAAAAGAGALIESTADPAPAKEHTFGPTSSNIASDNASALTATGTNGAIGLTASSDSNNAVKAVSASGVGGYFEGGAAPLRLGLATTDGPPTSGAHNPGELYVDSSGVVWVCTVDGSPGTWVQVASSGANVIPSLALAQLPPTGSAGSLAHVVDADSSQGLWMHQGTQWFSTSGQTFDVKEFGAKGDGTADDTDAINAALSAAQQRDTVYGGLVYFPPGTYKVTAPLIVYSNTVVRGASNRSAVISVPANSSVGGYGGVFQVGTQGAQNSPIYANDVVIERLGFSLGATSAAAVVGIAYNRLLIRDCYITAPGNNAPGCIVLTSGLGTNGTGSLDHCTVEGCHFFQGGVPSAHQSTAGVLLKSGNANQISNTRVLHCRFEQLYGGGVRLLPDAGHGGGLIQNTLVAGNTFLDLIGDHGGPGYSAAVGAGIEMAYQVTGLTIVHNIYSNVAHADQWHMFAGVYACSDVRIIGNSATCDGTSNSMFLAPGKQNSPVRGLIVQGNYINAWGGGLWDADSMMHVVVSDNVLLNSGHSGGTLLGYGTKFNVDIHDNLFYNTWCWIANNGAFLARAYIGIGAIAQQQTQPAPPPPPWNQAQAIQVKIHDNTWVDDVNSPDRYTQLAVATQGFPNQDFSGVVIRDNSFYLQNYNADNFRFFQNYGGLAILPNGMAALPRMAANEALLSGPVAVNGQTQQPPYPLRLRFQQQHSGVTGTNGNPLKASMPLGGWLGGGSQPPAVPASPPNDSPVANPFDIACVVYVTVSGGAITKASIDGTPIAATPLNLTGSMFHLLPGQTIALAYTSGATASWTWFPVEH